MLLSLSRIPRASCGFATLVCGPPIFPMGITSCRRRAVGMRVSTSCSCWRTLARRVSSSTALAASTAGGVPPRGGCCHLHHLQGRRVGRRVEHGRVVVDGLGRGPVLLAGSLAGRDGRDGAARPCALEGVVAGVGRQQRRFHVVLAHNGLPRLFCCLLPPFLDLPRPSAPLLC